MGDVIKMSWPDRLKLKGVMCRGYGILPKYAMCDNSLPLTAKAIYAYFCSMSGSGDTAWPGRDTAVSQLNISLQTYYKNLDILKEQGYISIQKQTTDLGRFSHNIYYIEENPKKFSEQHTSPKKEGETVSFLGIKGAGYGMIPRAVMIDARLDVKAKGIYAYFASFTGVGQAAFPEVKTLLYHLHINKDTYHKHLRALVAANYIVVKQRHQDGRLGKNDYFLVTNPDESAVVDRAYNSKLVSFTKDRQQPKKQHTDESVAAQAFHQQPKKQYTDESAAAQAFHQQPKKQYTEKQYPVNQLPGKQYTAIQHPEEQSPEKLDTNITSVPIISSSNTSSSYTQSISQPKHEDELVKMLDGLNKKELTELILNNIGIYNELFGGEQPSTQALSIQRLVNIVVDTISIKSPTIHIGKIDRERQDVITRLYSLTKDHYIYVLQSIQKQTNPIKSPVQYRLAALYNAPTAYEVEPKQESNAWIRKYIDMRERESG